MAPFQKLGHELTHMPVPETARNPCIGAEGASGLPRQAEVELKLLKVRREKRIQEFLAKWLPNDPANEPQLEPQRVTQLKELIISGAVEIGEKEARERLAVISSAELFEAEAAAIIERVAHNAADRWAVLSTGIVPELGPEDSPNTTAEIRRRIHRQLAPKMRVLTVQALSRDEKRLAAELDPDALEFKDHQDPKAPLGEKVKELRKSKGWSEDTLATEADLDKKTIRRIETRGRARGETISKLATAFGIDRKVLE